MTRRAAKRTILLSAAACIALSGRAAFAAEPIEPELGGYFSGAAGIVEGVDAADQDVVFGGYGGIELSGSTILDNALEVAVKALLEFDSESDAVSGPFDDDDEITPTIFMTVDGIFGRVQFGQQDGAADQLHVPTPGAFEHIGSTDKDLQRLDALDIASISVPLDEAIDATKINYFTPRLLGLQFGLSYAPDLEKTDGDFVPLTAAEGSDAFELGLSYQREFNDVWFEGSASYYTDQRQNGMADPSHYATALQFGFGGFAFGGGFTWGDNLSRNGYSPLFDSSIWSAGFSYGNGPWLFGMQYAMASEAPVAGGADSDSSSMTGGLSYELGPYIQVGAGLQYDDADISFERGSKESGTAIFFESGLKF